MKVLVSRGFDPLHIGHIRMFEEAKRLGDYLIVLVNNDNWLMKKKGSFFMSQSDRVEILQHIDCVDKVILTKHVLNDMRKDVCEEIKEIHPDIFANGGD